MQYKIEISDKHFILNARSGNLIRITIGIHDRPAVFIEIKLEHIYAVRGSNAGISRLTAREQKIMQMRFGLDGCKERTQREVADELGISQSYISRLEKRIIKRLRGEISAKM